jgi:hypothetical protein
LTYPIGLGDRHEHANVPHLFPRLRSATSGQAPSRRRAE